MIIRTDSKFTIEMTIESENEQNEHDANQPPNLPLYGKQNYQLCGKLIIT